MKYPPLGKVKNPFFILFILFSSTFLLNSCKERLINPFEEREGAFSIYGAMKIDGDKSYIRVRDVTEPFLADSNRIKKLSASLENLSNGELYTLRDTIINYNGNFTSNFIIDEDLSPRQTYKLSVTGESGKTSSSLATTPGVSSYSFLPNNLQSCETPIRFKFQNVKAPEFIRMQVGFNFEGVWYYDIVGDVDQFRQDPEANETEVVMSITNLLVEVFPPPPEARVGKPPKQWRPLVSCSQLENPVEIKIRYIHFGPEWEVFLKNGQRDINYFEAQDVDNGFGFFGSIREGNFSFGLDSSL